MKKITLLLTAVFVLSAASMYAQQYNPDSDFRIDWDKGAANAVIITKYIGSRSDVRIPPKIQNYTVTQIADRAFERTGIISVTIPDSVTSIRNRAFYNCTKLASVTIPNSVEVIWSGAFKGCTSLTSITIPASVTRIMSEAFYDCTNLTSVMFQGETPSWSFLWGSFDGNLESYNNSGNIGPGTYTRFAGGKVWKPNFTPQETAARQAAQNASAAQKYFDSGKAAYDRKDYDKAIADYTEAIRLNPINDAAYHRRGWAYNGKGDYDRAIADTEAIRLNKSASFYNNRADSYNSKSDYDRAIADATEAIRLDPNFANPYRHRGFAYMMKGNYTQARADTNKALQLDPNYQRAKDLDAELKKKGY